MTIYLAAAGRFSPLHLTPDPKLAYAYNRVIMVLANA